MDEKLKEQNYVEELIEIIRSAKSNEELRDKLSDYHENDIADAFVRLDEEERKRLYPILGAEQVAEIFTCYRRYYFAQYYRNCPCISPPDSFSFSILILEMNQVKICFV